MSKDEVVLQWLHRKFLEQWKQFLNISKNFRDQDPFPYNNRKIILPFIPTEADGYSLRNFIALVLKFLFNSDSNSFVIIIYDNHNSVLWTAFQKTESYSFIELIELNEHLSEFNSFLKMEGKKERLRFLKNLLEKLEISSELGFYLLINVEVVSEFKAIWDNHFNLLEFYSRIWDLMARNFDNKKLQFFPEPLFFKFFRRLTTKNVILNASEFQKFFGNLLPTQNLIINFLDKDFPSAFAILSKQNELQLQFLNYDFLQNHLRRWEVKQEKGLEYFNKIIKTTTPLLTNNQKVKATAAITITEDIWLMVRDIMSRYSFEYLFDRFFDIIREVEEKWTIERKFILFRRWGKSFMGFQLHRLIPTQITSIITSILSFQNAALTRTAWFIVNDSLELIYILGADFQEGQFNRIYMISNPTIFELFNSEPDKALGVKKVHSYLAETDAWVNQILVITTQDLNLLISFLPLLTSIKGSLKYLNMIENIITYRMYFYPPNFFADLISRKGATYFFKDIMFPMFLGKS